MDKKIISTRELQEMLDQKQDVFILDVRPTDQREEWRIAESTHLDAYKRLNSGDNRVLDEAELPSGVPVVTVCAAGKTSLIASEALRAKGINAFSLEGGMKAWNYAWNKASIDLPSGLRIIQVRRPAKGVLSISQAQRGRQLSLMHLLTQTFTWNWRVKIHGPSGMSWIPIFMLTTFQEPENWQGPLGPNIF